MRLLAFVQLFLLHLTLSWQMDCGRQTPHPEANFIRKKVQNFTHKFGRIIGGNESPVGRWPWQALLTITDERRRYICGGSIIADRWILTAAHCFSPKAQIKTIMFGSVYAREGNVGKLARAKQFIVHENYQNDDACFPNDIAIVELAEAITFDYTVSPICLASMSTKLHEEVQVVATGFGKYNDRDKTYIGEQATGALNLLETFFPLIPTHICSKRLNMTLPSTNICGGSYGHGTAPGDSGGPIFADSKSGRWFQIGLTSFGKNDDVNIIEQDMKPGVYTKIAAYCDWIEEKTSGDAKCQDAELIDATSPSVSTTAPPASSTTVIYSSNSTESLPYTTYPSTNTTDPSPETTESSLSTSDSSPESTDYTPTTTDSPPTTSPPSDCGRSNPPPEENFIQKFVHQFTHKLDRIIGGDESPVGRWPWQVRVITTEEVDARNNYICGGTIIADRWILTAAHCFFDDDTGNRTKIVNFIIFGSVKARSSENIARAKKFSIHNEYLHGPENNFVNDIAVIELAEPITFDKTASPICLASMNTSVHETTQVIAIGFGWINYFTPSSALLETVFPLVPKDICNKRWNTTMRDTHLCGGANGHGTAPGDSGGPIFTNTASGRWFQVGLTSFGKNDPVNLINQGDMPGVYTNTAKYCDWIEENTRGEAKCQDAELVDASLSRSISVSSSANTSIALALAALFVRKLILSGQ